MMHLSTIIGRSNTLGNPKGRKNYHAICEDELGPNELDELSRAMFVLFSDTNTRRDEHLEEIVIKRKLERAE